MIPSPQSYLTHLVCPECDQTFDADTLQTVCADCRSPLLAVYDLEQVSQNLTPDIVSARPRGMWRWAEVLPVRDPLFRLTLGEGDTPLLPLNTIADSIGITGIYLKEEALNPTGSFKARGLCAAVSRACELGAKALVVPTAGNAGGALATYAARAHMEAHVYMPKDAPHVNQEEVRAAGADLHLVDGLINDAAKLAAADAARDGWFDVSTFKEPYRAEGKKIMGYELAEAFHWDLPDVIIYPTGGGTGLVGMWKAFDELQTLGWIGEKRPRMVSVQAEGCAPVVRAFNLGDNRAELWQNAHTIASGLRVPYPFADRLILDALRSSGGLAIAVSDEEILSAQDHLARKEGIFAAPEGAATLAALYQLELQGWIGEHEKVVLFNTGAGIKYL